MYVVIENWHPSNQITFWFWGQLETYEANTFFKVLFQNCAQEPKKQVSRSQSLADFVINIPGNSN